jgi:hypothetical protein
VLGHGGEMFLFPLDRIDSLPNVATHLDRRAAEYFATNVHVATSGILSPRMLRHGLDYTSPDRILLSGDHPFHRLHAATIADFLRSLPGREDQQKIAHANAEPLYDLTPSPSGPGDQTAQLREQS